MPLTVEFSDYEKKEFGRLVIDRDNLIIQFLPKSDFPVDREAAIEKREKFTNSTRRYWSKTISKLVKYDGDIGDERHGITDHVSEADRAGYHSHLKFIRNIDLELMKLVINSIPKDVWLEFISEECYESLLEISTNYFLELQGKHQKISPAPAEIEQFYQEEKKQQFDAKTREMEEILEEDSEDIQLLSSLKLFFLQATFKQLLSWGDGNVAGNRGNLNLFSTIDSRQSPRAAIVASSLVAQSAPVTKPVAAIAKAPSTTAQPNQNTFFFADTSSKPEHASDRRNATAITKAATERDRQLRSKY